MAKLSISLTTGKALITAAGKWMLGCCCEPPPDCGCCVQTGSSPDTFECQDTERAGATGEDYCINTLGGTPLKGVWFNRRLECLPCDYSEGGSSTESPSCPLPPGDCFTGTCDDAGDAPSTIYVAVDGPFTETLLPPANGGDHTDDCWDETFQICAGQMAAILAQGAILEQDQGLQNCPPSPCESIHACGYSASVAFTFCPSEACADGPFGDPTPCTPPCQATLSVTATLVPACGYSFTLSASISPFGKCGDQTVGGGANGPCDDFNVILQWGPGAAGGGCMSGSDCFQEVTPGAELDVTDDEGVLDGTPDVVVLL